jgi:hypothetical protein
MDFPGVNDILSAKYYTGALEVLISYMFGHSRVLGMSHIGEGLHFLYRGLPSGLDCEAELCIEGFDLIGGLQISIFVPTNHSDR